MGSANSVRKQFRLGGRMKIYMVFTSARRDYGRQNSVLAFPERIVAKRRSKQIVITQQTLRRISAVAQDKVKARAARRDFGDKIRSVMILQGPVLIRYSRENQLLFPYYAKSS
jgi:hypothetical protein